MRPDNVAVLPQHADLARARLAPPSLRRPRTEEAARRFAARVWVVELIAQCMRTSDLSPSPVVEGLIEQAKDGTLPAYAAQMLRQSVMGESEFPARATMLRWYAKFAAGGEDALADQHTGRRRADQGWEVRAAHLFRRSSRPAMSTVAAWLRAEGWESATDHAVRRYLNSLPSHLAETSPRRVGPHFYAQNIRPHVARDATVLDVGFIYEGDGHTCDVYVEHPKTGKAWRPELTVWLDVRSGYCVGWWISEAESAATTINSLSRALADHNHVPTSIHVDPGSGFANRLMLDELAGWLSRAGINFMPTLPGNARGKGLVEGWFRHFEERCGKRFPTYCGAGARNELLRRLSSNVQQGLLKLPTLRQYCDAIADYVEQYNAGRHPNEKGSRAQIWARLERTPISAAAAESLTRPAERRTVRRWTVTLHGRQYQDPALAAHEGREVLVEYDLRRDARAWVRDLSGALVCEAALVHRRPWLTDSHIEDLQRNRLAGQIKRLELAAEEKRRRAGLVIGHTQLLDEIEAIDAAALSPPENPGTGAATPAPGEADQGGDDAPLDLYRTDY